MWSEEKLREKGFVMRIRTDSASVEEKKGVRKRTRKMGSIKKTSKVDRRKQAKPVGESGENDFVSVRRSKRLGGEPIE